MKKNLILIICILTFNSCKNKAEKEKLEIEKAKQANAIDQIIGIGKIIPENDIIQLSSLVNGIVHKIYKKDNDSVAIGTIVLELEHQLEDEKIIQLSHQISTQAAQVNADEATINELDAKMSNTKNELIRLQNLLDKGAETQQTVDNAGTNLKSQIASLNKSKANKNLSESRLLEVKTNLKSAQLEREQKIIKSPINGRILELSVLIGGSVSLQQSIGQISPEGNTVVICEIDELNASKVKVGQHGWIRSVGSSDTLSTGIIYFASSFLKKKSLFTDQSGEKEDRRVRTIKMLLDEPKNLLLNARVECVVAISNKLKK
jgi:multidrug efflux pump subunit AcrA (membrane-fusion protein)